MMVSVGDLIWGAIGLATLALIVTLVAVGLELRGVLRVISSFAAQVERDISPLMQDLQHIMHRLDAVSEVVEDKVEQTSHFVDRVEESFAVGRVRARDAWDDTREWLGSLSVGWHAGMQVFRDGGDGHPGGNGHHAGNGHVPESPVTVVCEETRAESHDEPAIGRPAVAVLPESGPPASKEPNAEAPRAESRPSPTPPD